MTIGTERAVSLFSRFNRGAQNARFAVFKVSGAYRSVLFDKAMEEAMIYKNPPTRLVGIYDKNVPFDWLDDDINWADVHIR